MLLQIVLFFAFTISLSLTVSTATTFPVKDSKEIIFAFGSCSSRPPEEAAPVYRKIIEHNPDLYAWLGDAVYLWGNDEQYVLNQYKHALNEPGYQELIAKVPIIGTWDDHDYGPDNGDKNFEFKERNKQIFLDYLGEPTDSPRRTRDGVYEAYYLGEDKAVKVILLDVRYNRDERISLNRTGDILGERQWEWFEEELRNNDALFTLVGSGTQVLTDDRIYPEAWYHASTERLFSVIRKYQKSGVILMSGDVHFAEILKYPCPQKVGYNLYELVSSGITHYLFVETIVNIIYTRIFNEPEDRYYGRHFTTIKFSIDGSNSRALVEYWDYHGMKVLERDLGYEEFKFNESIVDENSFCVADLNEFIRWFSNWFMEASKGNQIVVSTSVFGLGVLGTLFGFCFYLIKKPEEIEVNKED